jgi:hypothetical protein
LRSRLLVTGYARSGITLVNRLLDSHPQVSIADRLGLGSLVRAMQCCRSALGFAPQHAPFTPLFDEDGPSVEQVREFFCASRWTPSEAEAGLGFAGASLRGHRADAGLDLADLLRDLMEARWAAAGKPAARVVGMREHFCEVLAPYLLARGFYVLFVIRDPLDLVASARLGRHGWALNRRVSVLEMVRQWRKSVALAITTAHDAKARIVRYEDLVARPEAWSEICRWLDIDALQAVDLLRARGSWTGNSSFGPLVGLSREPVGRGARLAPELAAFVRAATAPERAWLGWERERPGLVPYRPEAEIDPERAPEASLAALESDRESRRRELLAFAVIPPRTAERWFVSALAHRQLHRVWAAAGATEGATGRM